MGYRGDGPSDVYLDNRTRELILYGDDARFFNHDSRPMLWTIPMIRTLADSGSTAVIDGGVGLVIGRPSHRNATTQF